jgi:Tfp pilus assembly protein PilN
MRVSKAEVIDFIVRAVNAERENEQLRRRLEGLAQRHAELQKLKDDRDAEVAEMSAIIDALSVKEAAE